MANKIEIFRQFKSLGINVQEDILNCAVDMCGRLFIDEREIVETWMAYSINNLNGAKPTVELLLQMEQKEFAEKSFGTPKRNELSIFEISSKKKSDIIDRRPDIDGCVTPKRSKPLNADQSNQFSPAGFSSNLGTPSSKYAQRSNAGESQANYRKSLCDWRSEELELKISPYIKQKDWMSMHGTLVDDNKLLVDVANELTEGISDKCNIGYLPDSKNNDEDSSTNKNDDSATTNNTQSSIVGEDCLFGGRVLGSDSSKLSIGSISVKNTSQEDFDVDFSGVVEYSLFPGQVILYKGTKRGKKISATQIYSSATLPQLDKPPSLSAPLQILIASGPFTQSDTLSYEPLQDLLKYAKAHKPHIIFLIGPIIDSNHTNVNNGSMAESFSEFYKKFISGITDSLSGTDIKVFIVSSSKDAFNTPIYPTKPLTIEPEWKDMILPDPCLLDINGVIIGLTSTDILMHLGKREISNGGNRLARLASHLIHQQSFYPLYPPDLEVSLDLNLWYNNARLPVTPHLLVTPSDLHNFVKEIDGVVVVNPERLAKGSVSGNFACIEVQPQVGDDLWSAKNYIAAKIVKI